MNRVKSVNNVFLATVLISILGSFFNEWVVGFTNNYFILLLISQIVLIIPSVVYIAIYKVNVRKAIRFNKVKLSNVILAIVFAYLITPLMNLINAISMLFVENDISDVAFNIVENNGFILTIFMMALVPCILEETVYRGLFYNEYSKVSPLKAILLSGFLFGIMHQNFNQFSYAFAMGIIFALLIEATNSILTTMIVHFVINGTSVAILALLPKLLDLAQSLYGADNFNAQEWMDSLQGGIEESLTLPYILQTYGFTAIIATVLAVIVYRTIAKNAGRWDYVKDMFRRKPAVIMENKPRLVSVTLIIGIVICIALMFVTEFYSAKIPEQPLTELIMSVIK